MSKSTNKGAKRQKLSPMEGKVAVVPVCEKNYGTILELALPFLPFEDMFANVSLVSKGIHQLCSGQLRQHCQKRHPVLLHLAAQNSADEQKEKDTWLTYGRYRRFLRTDGEARPPATEKDPQKLFTDYEMIVEVSTLDDEPKVLYYDIQRLEYDNTEERKVIESNLTGSKFPENTDLNNLPSPEKGLRIRLLMRRKSSGELANILNETAYTKSVAIDVTEDEQYESGKQYFYSVNNLLPNGHEEFHALVQLRVCKTYEGKLNYTYLASCFIHRDENCKFLPELLIRAILTWNWF